MANWKMHGSMASVEKLTANSLGLEDLSQVDVAVCPSFVHIPQVLAQSVGTRLKVGAQDCSHMQSGAYTGEVSPDMLADLGCEWVLLGHSERRQYHAESDSLVAAKFAAVLNAGLKPVLCVGETQEQREGGEAFTVVAGQLHGALAAQSGLQDVVIAYEPVWAIGTGLTATPDEAQEMHRYIRMRLAELGSLDAEQVRLLYGGSVKAANAPSLFSQPDIDGALVGGASLDGAEFAQIIAAAV